MKVYRFEKNGYGIFCEAILRNPDDALYSLYGYTCKQEYRNKTNWRSACDSIDKLIDYFGSDFAYVLDKGASLVEYVLPKQYVIEGIETYNGSIEVIFDSSKATAKTVILTTEEGGSKSIDNIYKSVFTGDLLSFEMTSVIETKELYALFS